MSHRVFFAGVAATTLLAAVLVFHGLAARSFWFDEVWSVVVSGKSWAEMWEVLLGHEAAMWAYYVVLHGWLFFGQDEFAVRSLSAVGAILSIPVMALLGRTLFDERVGLLSALLLAVNLSFVMYAQEARSYALFLLGSLISTLFFARAAHGPESARDWIGFAIVSAVNTHWHLFAVFLTGLQLVAYPFLRVGRGPWLGFALSFGFVVASWIPSILLLPSSQQVDWIGRPAVYELVALYPTMLGGGVILPLLVAGCCAVAVLVSVGDDSWRKVGFLLAWLVGPPLGVFVLSFLLRPLFVTRYFLFCLPAVVLTCAVGLVRLRPRLLAGFVACGIVVASAVRLEAFYDRVFTKPGMREVVAAVTSRCAADDAVICYTYPQRHPYAYYANQPGIDVRPVFVEAASAPSLYAGGSDPDPPVNAALLRDLPERHPRVWFVETQVFGRRRENRDRIATTLDAGYESHETEAFGRIELHVFSQPRTTTGNSKGLLP